MNRFLRVGLWGAALALVITGCNRLRPTGQPSGPVTVTATDFAGVENAIAAAKGKVVLIDLWATWCGPCVRSFPRLVEKSQKYGPKGLAVISVSLDDPKKADEVLAFLTKNKAAFTNLHLTMNPAARQGLAGEFAYEGSIPHAVLFDKTGKRVWAGHPMDDDLAPLIEAELAKK